MKDWRQTFYTEITYEGHGGDARRMVVKLIAPNFDTARSIITMHKDYVRAMNPMIQRILKVVD